ncbi:DNA mismatch repair endonuclease MutL [Eubacteriales bacterium OttesenSCG-928-K08]|nr:DNA mismatch repair endonuclease MutL [Eubacteriales bacterium OttesenSCG-928-K08]
MTNIKKLNPHIANQIAAGEVVERPASVVKELVENAIDAGATSITIEIENGGLSSILVADNGAGIPPEECELAFERHATSKISSQDDLFNINTLGFRGEALASIAAVSQVELKSRRENEALGMRIRIEGGERTVLEPVSCTKGSTLTVNNLFYNVPARRKFLKSERTEAAHIGDYILRMILARPDICFHYSNNAKTVYRSTGDGKLKNAIYSVYGKDVLPHLKKADFDDGYLKIEGYVGAVELARPNRTQQSFFVNGRYIQSPALSVALSRAYEQHLMSKRFPFAILMLTISNAELDVNVHPTKMEVRFAQEGRVFQAMTIACSRALGGVSIPKMSWPQNEAHSPTPPAASKAAQAQQQPLLKSTLPKLQAENLSSERPTFYDPTLSDNVPVKEQAYPGTIPHFHVPPLAPVQAVPILPEPTRTKQETGPEIKKIPEQIQTDFGASPITIIGQAFGVYWFVQQKENLFVIDQHAAHERRLYETMMAEDYQPASQALLVPETMQLTPTEYANALEYLAELNALGFDAVPLDKNALRIFAVPLLLAKSSVQNLLRDVLDLMDKQACSAEKQYRREAIVQSACKHAIKAGDIISEQEIADLLEYFNASGAPLTCPHGRPVLIKMDRKELEKLFKRIV